jgi:hypothetical protein
MNGFLLSMISPYFYGMVCGSFAEGLNRRLELGQVESGFFTKLIELTCSGHTTVSRVCEVVELARLADHYQMDEVSSALEDEAVRLLTVETCAELFTSGMKSGLSCIVEECKKLALTEFEAVANSAGFLRMGEEVLKILLESDSLVVSSEETLLDHVVQWMTVEKQADRIRGLEMLQLIRFPLMEARHLAVRARQILPNQMHLEALVLEAMAVKSLVQQDRANFTFRYLLPKSLQPRAKRSVDWGRYLQGRDVKRIGGATGTTIHALWLVDGLVCCGCEGGTIDVYKLTTESLEKTLLGHTSLVCALTSWDGWLISGSADKSIKVWDLSRGECVRTLDGHTWRVSALAVFGSKLLSGSWDSTIKIWEISVAENWKCEQTLTGHAFSVHSLIVREGKIFSSSSDNTIRVWDMSSGLCDRTLVGHEDSVLALAINESNLFSAAMDGMIRVWRLDSLECLRTIQMYSSDSALYITCLAIHGNKLLSGSCGDDDHDPVVSSIKNQNSFA